MLHCLKFTYTSHLRMLDSYRGVSAQSISNGLISRASYRLQWRICLSFLTQNCQELSRLEPGDCPATQEFESMQEGQGARGMGRSDPTLTPLHK